MIQGLGARFRIHRVRKWRITNARFSRYRIHALFRRSESKQFCSDRKDILSAGARRNPDHGR